jgi:phosphate transport system substrate-binding protein
MRRTIRKTKGLSIVAWAYVYVVIKGNKMKKIVGIAVALILLMSLVDTNAKEANEPNTGVSARIVISGTGDSQELMRALAEAFMKKHSGCEIEVPDSIGSSKGIKAVANGKIDLARVARLLNKDEKKLGLTYQLFAKSPVVFAVHPGVGDINNITSEQIVGIYSGRITDWSQLGGKAGKIYPITREAGDSSLLALNEKLPGFADVNNLTAKIVYLTPETVAALTGHERTIGYVPLPAIAGTQLRVLKIDGVYPSLENIRNGKYNLVAYFGVVYKGKPRELAQRFIDFIYNEEGQKIITAMGAMPAR